MISELKFVSALIISMIIGVWTGALLFHWLPAEHGTWWGPAWFMTVISASVGVGGLSLVVLKTLNRHYTEL